MDDKRSEDIKELVNALCKAQAVMKPAVFNKTNPHFKSKYADFASCMDACRQPLSDNGLAIMQICDTINGALTLVTILAHISGQYIRSEFPLISVKQDSQGYGSALTYAKRYCLSAMIGIVADEDDDGNAASDKPPSQEPTKKNPVYLNLTNQGVRSSSPVISYDQSVELCTLLNSSDKYYQKRVFEHLNKYNPPIKEDLSNLPASDYARLKDGAIKNQSVKSESLNDKDLPW